MKQYIVKKCLCNDCKITMTAEEYDKWVSLKAKANYGLYRIVGDPSSNHFHIDFDSMWEVNVIEAADGNNQ